MTGSELKFRRLADRLRQEITDGIWPPGSRLPTEPELARDNVVSVSTVRRAVTDLVAEELVERRQGSGTFVLPGRAARRSAPLIGVIVPDTAFYYPRVLGGIAEVLAAAGSRHLIACSGYDPARELTELREMLDAGADGLLVVPTLTGPPGGPADYLHRLAELPVPVVLVERRGTTLGDPTESVCTHHEAAGTTPSTISPGSATGPSAWC
ncbi:GntR family transcriptional regulator [Kitasatospora gansuensis]